MSPDGGGRSRLAALRDEADRLCADPRLREAVWRHCPGPPPGVPASALNTRIHPDDQMLRHSLNTHGDANAAVSQYFSVALQQYDAAQQIRQAVHGGVGAANTSVLDFACGFGRFLRFISAAEPETVVRASEIQATALEFVAREFGVQGVPSGPDPADFSPDRRFGFIWVASLFSHLPEALFHGWLQRLRDCLGPGGTLCFSVHDERLMADDRQLSARGIHFAARSESPELAADIYGVTHVSEAFVADAIRRAFGAGHGYRRIPQGLAHQQDIYVVCDTRPAAVDVAFRRGPWGWVQERALSATGELYLMGWAASLDDGHLDAVAVTVNGCRYQCAIGLPRQDVADFFSDSRLNRCGWEFRLMLGDVVSAAWVEVSVTNARGERVLLFVGEMNNPAFTASRSGHRPGPGR